MDSFDPYADPSARRHCEKDTIFFGRICKAAPLEVSARNQSLPIHATCVSRLDCVARYRAAVDAVFDQMEQLEEAPRRERDRNDKSG